MSLVELKYTSHPAALSIACAHCPLMKLGLRLVCGCAPGGLQDMDVDMDARSSSSAGLDRAMAAATVGAGCSMVAAQLLSSSPSLHPDLWGSGADTRGLAGDIPR